MGAVLTHSGFVWVSCCQAENRRTRVTILLIAFVRYEYAALPAVCFSTGNVKRPQPYQIVSS